MGNSASAQKGPLATANAGLSWRTQKKSDSTPSQDVIESTPEFTSAEIERLRRRFGRLAASQGDSGVSLQGFTRLPEFVGNPFAGRLFQLYDSNKDGFLGFEEFKEALTGFRRSQNAEEKCKLIFRVYDSDGDGVISAEDLFITLRMVVGRELSDTLLKDIVQSVIEGHDESGDGKLSLDEFRKLLSKGDFDTQFGCIS
ncbi:hypothetical protein CYMTET_52661 [Cymbomonas tetramitiformis]|uniref:EF-hand domain-containing protein n=1 Tax=Cymbomonas tetramitiformis TaxID=36881 RepID=A0AAE0ERE7_9CHLO|nr:hypothetical protein CYMTET_52661 [Cymbomonas tetramitiformis]